MMLNLENQNTPYVSVILPIRNEQDYIAKCLDSLLSQSYPAESFEIIVADGQSVDQTREIIEHYIVQYPGRIRLLDNPRKIVPTALNIAIKAARGDIIMRMDGHTVPCNDYIAACTDALQRSKAANAGGIVIPRGDTPFGEAVAQAQSHRLGVGGAMFRYARGSQPQYVDTLPFGTFNKDTFLKTGLFDESMPVNEDYEMNVRIRKAGCRVYLDPKIYSFYTPRNTFSKLWRQYFKYGWWRVETLRRHPGSLRLRQALPPSFVGLNVLLLVLSPFALWAEVFFAIQTVAYLCVVLGTALILRDTAVISRPLRLRFNFVLAIITMHYSYGFGFLLSLFSNGNFPYRAKPPKIPTLR